MIYLAPAIKALRNLDPVWRRRIQTKMLDYAASPSSFANVVVRLQGEPLLRIRIGDYRVIFTEDGTIVTVTRLGHRSSVYGR